MPIEVVAHANLKDCQDCIGGIRDRLKDFRPALEEIRKDVRETMEKRFRSSGAFEGERWRPLTPEYGRRKMRRWGAFKPILTASGALRRSLTKQTALGASGRIEKNRLLVQSNIEVNGHNLADIHDQGKGVQPVRRIYVIHPDQVRRWAKIITDWVAREGGARRFRLTSRRSS